MALGLASSLPTPKPAPTPGPKPTPAPAPTPRTTPKTHIIMVVDNDAARKMYYERYIMDRDVSLAHSANTGGKVSLEDQLRARRQATKASGDDVADAEAATPVEGGEPAPAGVVSISPAFADLLKSIGAHPQPRTSGAGYTRRRRSPMETYYSHGDAEYPVHRPREVYMHRIMEQLMQSGDTEGADQYRKLMEKEHVPAGKISSDLAASILKLAGAERQEVSRGAGYTKRSAQHSFPTHGRVPHPSHPRFAATEEVHPTVEPETVEESVPAKHAPAGQISPGLAASILKLAGATRQEVSRGAGYTKRSAQHQEPSHPNVAISSPVEEEDSAEPPSEHAPAGQISSSLAAFILKHAGAEPQAVSEGAGYTKRSAQHGQPTVHIQEEASIQMTEELEVPTEHAPAGQISPGLAAFILQHAGAKPQAVSVGAGYTKRSAQYFQNEAAHGTQMKKVYQTEEVTEDVEVEEPETKKRRPLSINRDLATLYMLQGGPGRGTFYGKRR